MRKIIHITSIALTLILSVLTIIGAFTTKVSPASSAFMSFLGIGLPVLLGACAVMAIYWAIRFRYWVWAPLLAIVCNWSYMASMCQPFGGGELAHHEVTLKVATFNVGRFGGDNNGHNQRRVAFFMGEENVDVICMQEYKERGNVQADELADLFAPWPFSIVPKEEGKALLQLAVYSRYPIIDSKLITYPNTPNCSMWCDIDFNGERIRIFNNHLQTTNVNQSRGMYEKYYKNSGSIDADIHFAENASNMFHANEILRASQADIINQLVKESPYPVIVCGDFNSPPSSYVYGTMKGELKDGFRTAGRGYGGTYRYFKGLPRIDYIFHSSSLRGIRYYSTKMDLGSDHNPVVFEIDR